MGLSHALVHSYMLIFPVVLLLIIKEFSIGYFLAGLVGTISGFAFGLGALPAGIFADRVGAKRLIVVYLAGASLSSILVGLSTSFFFFAMGLGTLGLFCSFFHPSGYALVSSGTREMGRAFGYVGAAGNIGLALAPLLVGYLASHLGWRMAFALFSIPGFLLVSLVFLLRTGVSTARPVVSSRANPFTSSASGGPFLTLPLLLLCFAYAMNGLTFQGAMTFLPTYLSQGVRQGVIQGDAVTLGGTLASMALMVGVFGQYMGGRLGQGPQVERSLLTINASCVPFLILMGFKRDYFLLLAAFGFAFFHFANHPLLNVILAKNTSARLRGLGYGLAFFLSFGVGSFSATLSGYIAERLGLNAVFFAMAAVTFLQALSVLFLWKLGPRS